MVIIDGKQSIKRITDAYKGISGRELRIITAKSINGAINKTKAPALASTKEDYNIGSKWKNTYMRAEKAKPTWPIGKLKISDKRIPISSFDPSQQKAGVSVEVHKGKPKLIKGSFFGKMKSGHTGIFAKSKPGKAYQSGGFRFRTKRIKPPSKNDTTIAEMSTLSYRKMFLHSIENVYNEYTSKELNNILHKNLRKAIINR